MAQIRSFELKRLLMAANAGKAEQQDDNGVEDLLNEIKDLNAALAKCATGLKREKTISKGLRKQVKELKAEQHAQEA